jgi:uncharacterized protein
MTSGADATPILVFAKGLAAGAVKTRLAPLLDARGAAALHSQLVEQTLATAAAAAIGAVYLYGAPGDDTFLAACATRHGATLRDQSRGDLGQRMCVALAAALGTAPHAILVGTDCPVMTVRHLRQAAVALEAGADAVFVPVEDGGYALVGVSRAEPRLFQGIPWSTDRVMEVTRDRLRELGRSWTELETLWDIDRPADYERFLALGAHAPPPAGSGARIS